jgi:hypothetical protein
MTNITDPNLIDITLDIAAMHIRDVLNAKLQPPAGRKTRCWQKLHQIVSDAQEIQSFLMDPIRKLEAAATSLRKSFGREYPKWLASIGVTSDSLIVYLSAKRHPAIPTEWEGYPVTTKFIGKLRLN